ncbi:MAG TPA: hypothetical protein PLZ05_01640, partial [Alphaproteobacteria bacterium]|nr:hypothetical protein [Alphaproteobacteria bacterium]
DSNTSTCQSADAFTKSDLQYGKNVTKNDKTVTDQCWTMVTPDDYRKCVLRSIAIVGTTSTATTDTGNNTNTGNTNNGTTTNPLVLPKDRFINLKNNNNLLPIE